MCGIAGIYAYHYAAPEINREELRGIRDFMSPRGPDGTGEWYSEDGRIGLGHRRLAIIDLSPRGAQPMQTEDGNAAVILNGEIYNYRELRSELQKKGRVFHSESDTEVLLHLYAEKGSEMVRELRGMFAFILWDSQKKIMLLARDPYGIKPLYYADDGWTVRAASQVKALLASDKVSRIPEPAGIAGFFLMGSVPEPHTLYQEIRQVPAGSVVTVNAVGPSSPKKYFSIAEVFNPLTLPSPPQEGEGGGEGEVVRPALLDSVRHHLVSDVPVGLFLSGGIDSGALAGLVREIGVKDFRTVTLAFREFQGQAEDESLLAEETARLYGMKHHKSFLTKDGFKINLRQMFEAMDQPTIDGINTYFVAKAAAETGLKVALSGLGGDEIFGGYLSFQEIPQLVKILAPLSPIPFGGEIFRRLFSRNGLHPKISGLVKYGGTYPGAYFLRRGLFMPWEVESILGKELAREGLRRLHLIDAIKKELEPDPKTPLGRVAVLEASFYLRNQLLRDADWAGMAHSLEIRTPFVDAWLLKSLAPLLISETPLTPLSPLQGERVRVRGKKGLLIDSLKIPLPDKVIDRAKTGFTVPIESWLETDEELGEWRRIPALARKECPWARRWAYVVMEKQLKGESRHALSVER